MNQLEKSHLIDEKLLDQKYYFQSLFSEACRLNLLTDMQIQQIQLEMVELMGKEVERYTNDESSSIRVEIAQDILQSISYCIGYLLKNTTDVTQKLDILKNEKISDLFIQGMNAVSSCKTKAELMLQDLQKNCLRIDNYAYQDTIFIALKDFFHDYIIEFEAHDIPASIDYPLYETGTEVLGVEYIEDYLERLTLEDLFLRHFPVKKINLLLNAFDREAEHILINIFELVLINALGCVLLGKSSLELHVSQKEQQWLQHNLEGLEQDVLKIKLESACNELFAELILSGKQAEYIRITIPKLFKRLTYNLSTNTLDRLFVSLEIQHQEEYFEDGISMDDEKLRELIDRLTNCETTTDKIALIKECIHSTADLIELMEESFYEDEYEQVLFSLSEAEKSVLRKSILQEFGQEHYSDFEPQTGWQRLLFQDK